MANVKISALPAVTTVVPGSDVLPLVSGGITTKATPNQIVQAVLPAPGAIGGTTPNAGAFTTLSASSTVSGTGFSTYLASPPAIGGTVAAAITGTTITANTGFVGAHNGTVGATTPNTGAFTTLSASSTVSGTGFSTYLASPPAIGGTTAAAGKFTTLEYTSTLTGGTGVIAIGTNQIYKDTSGNVGIGTSSPGAKLAISYSTTDGNGILITNTSNSGYATLQAVGSNGFGGGAWQNAFVVEAVPASSGGLVLGAYTGSIKFQTGARATNMTLDSSGNLGLGVTPSGWGSGTKAIEVGSKGTAIWNFSASDSYFTQNAYWNSGWVYASTNAASAYEQVTGSHRWYTVPSGTAGNAFTFTQAMTLDASGNLLVGTTSTLGAVVTNLKGRTGAAALGCQVYNNGDNAVNWYNASGTYLCSIVVNSASVAYNTSSDQRLKENIVDAPSAIDSINAIKVRSFDWKADGSHVDYGYIAQELLEVVPEAVSVPADSDEMMGVDFGKLTPRLVKAIQELHQEIETLKAKVNA